MKHYKMTCVYPNRKRNFDGISSNGDNDMDSPNEQTILEMEMWSELDASNIVIENCYSNLERLNKVFHILGGTHNLTSHFPIRGYSSDVIDIQNKNRGYYRAKHLVMKALEGICDIVVPNNVEFKNHLLDGFNDINEPITKLEKNLMSMISKENKNSQTYAKSLIASFFSITKCQPLMKSDCSINNDHEDTPVSQHGFHMGQRSFRSYRSIFHHISEWHNIPKNAYSYRISHDRIATTITYL